MTRDVNEVQTTNIFGELSRHHLVQTILGFLYGCLIDFLIGQLAGCLVD